MKRIFIEAQTILSDKVVSRWLEQKFDENDSTIVKDYGQIKYDLTKMDEKGNVKKVTHFVSTEDKDNTTKELFNNAITPFFDRSSYLLFSFDEVEKCDWCKHMFYQEDVRLVNGEFYCEDCDKKLRP